MNVKKCAIVICFFTIAILYIGLIKGKQEKDLAECVQVFLEENYLEDCKITKLGNYKEIEYSLVEPEQVTDENVEEMVNIELDRFSEIKKINKEKVENGDYIYVNYNVFCDGKIINQVTNEFLKVGSGEYNIDLEKALVGAKVGEKIVVELTIPDDGSGNELIGRKAEFYINVISINEYLTYELTDAFVQENYMEEGLHNKEEFYKWIKDKCKKNKEAEARRRNISNIKNKLIEISQYDMNKEQVAEYSVNIYKKYKEIAGVYGYGSLEEYYQKELRLTEKEFYNMCYGEGEMVIKEYLMIGAIANEENMDVTEEEIIEYCKEKSENFNEIDKNKYIYTILADKIYNEYTNYSSLSKK